MWGFTAGPYSTLSGYHPCAACSPRLGQCSCVSPPTFAEPSLWPHYIPRHDLWQVLCRWLIHTARKSSLLQGSWGEDAADSREGCCWRIEAPWSPGSLPNCPALPCAALPRRATGGHRQSQQASWPSLSDMQEPFAKSRAVSPAFKPKHLVPLALLLFLSPSTTAAFLRPSVPSQGIWKQVPSQVPASVIVPITGQELVVTPGPSLGLKEAGVALAS